jgi:16S rRNA (uracil1498-N3)-methyltransferase
MSAAPRFYCPLPLVAGTEAELPDAVVQHAVRALRLEPGAPLVLFTGEGGEFHGVLSHVSKNRATARIERHVDTERETTIDITLIQALTSNEKMDWIVQKAVELGVTRIQPILMERSVVRLAGERAGKRREHWQGVAVSACEQCGRNRVPQVLALADLRDATAALGAATRLMLSPMGSPLGDLPSQPPSYALLVGPEGGFSDAEARQLAQDWRAVRLGPRVLRTETAGLAGIAALQTLRGDWRAA